LQEEFEPVFPIAPVPGRLQEIVIPLAMPLEIMRQVEGRLAQDALFAQQEHDEQAPHAPVAVEEGVNGLELRMGEPDLEQKRQAVIGVQEPFERGKRIGDFLGRRWHENRLVHRASDRPDPVLRGAKGARRRTLTANALHHPFVDLADQAHRDGKRGQSIDTVFHRADMVQHFRHIAGPFGVENPRLVGEHFL